MTNTLIIPDKWGIHEETYTNFRKLTITGIPEFARVIITKTVTFAHDNLGFLSPFLDSCDYYPEEEGVGNVHIVTDGTGSLYIKIYMDDNDRYSFKAGNDCHKATIGMNMDTDRNGDTTLYIHCRFLYNMSRKYDGNNPWKIERIDLSKNLN